MIRELKKQKSSTKDEQVKNGDTENSANSNNETIDTANKSTENSDKKVDEN